MMKNRQRNRNKIEKVKENYLERIPVRNEEYDWKENGRLVTVIQKNKGIYNKMAQKFFKTPDVSNISLDEFGSFVWLQIDGSRTILEIGKLVKEEFGEKAEPLYERLSKYFYILKAEKFIKFK